MKDIELMKREYARMIVNQGINLEKGQSLMIKTSLACYPFASEVGQAAYEKGATHVEIRVDDLRLLNSRLSAQDDEKALSYIPPFFENEDEVMIEEGWAYVRIDNTDERDVLKNADPDKLALYSRANSLFHRKARIARMSNVVPWCVVCVPSDTWAKSILGEEAAEDDLWRVLAPILHLDQEDPSRALAEHNQAIERRAGLLNSRHITSLHFRSSQTDVTVGLGPLHKWEGGGDFTVDGRPFYPNIPTEEVFTTPHFKKVDGIITTTKPVTLFDSRVNEMRFTFKDGKVVEATASEGEDLLHKYLAIDEGSSFVGEIALVDQRSPIARADTVFNSILYDENASCHFALGAGYPTCLKLEHDKVNEQNLRDAGCNQSNVHTDFMFGSDDMSIVATDENGNEFVIMEDGKFTKDFE